MNRKVWFGSVVALLLAAAAICFVTPRLSGLILISLALAAVAVTAFRML